MGEWAGSRNNGSPKGDAKSLRAHLVKALSPAEPPANGLAPSLERKRLQAFLLMMLVDIGLIIGCFAMVSFAYLVGYRGQYTIEGAMLPAWLLLPLFLTIGLFNGTYSGSALASGLAGSQRVAAALLISAALLNFVAFFAKMNAEFSRVAFSISVVSAIMLMALFRLFLVRQLRRVWGPSPMNRLIINAGGPAISLDGAHIIDAKACGLLPVLDDPAALNRLAKYVRNMDEVLVSCPDDMRRDWSHVLRGASVHGEVVSEFALEVGAIGIRHYQDEAFSTLLISRGALRVRDRALKRLFDIGVSGLALLLLSPVMAMIAIAILLEDGRPILFRQHVRHARHALSQPIYTYIP